MSMLSTTAKTRLGVRTARQAAKHPTLTGRTVRAARPALRAARPALRAARPALRGAVKGTSRVERRRARHRAESLVGSGRAIGQTLLALGRQAADEAAEAQARRKRTMPRVAAGVAIGAGAMYFLEPGSGAEHRRRAQRLIAGESGGSSRP
ncbi:MAG TPA: hypothetical protein VFN65_02795 [Solirubrobacteraceae bacterium]|nr:hypothetical protein [Solirubrobacteraceae bacterium]